MSAIRLYQHPDGSFIDYDTDTRLLKVYEEEVGLAVFIPIGRLGLIELAKKMIEVGEEVPA